MQIRARGETRFFVEEERGRERERDRWRTRVVEKGRRKRGGGRNVVDEPGPILNRLCYADNGIMIENGFVATTGLMDFDGAGASGFAVLKGASWVSSSRGSSLQTVSPELATLHLLKD